MKLFRIAIIVVVIVVVGGVVYNLFSLRSKLEADTKELQNKVEALLKENKALTHDIQYFENKDNLLKELKSQFNYRQSGENIIIIVPDASSTGR